MNLEDGAFKPYLVRSAAIHAGLALGLLLLVRFPSKPSDQTFRIDFIGPSSVIIGREPDAAPARGTTPQAASEKIAPQEQKDEFASRARHAPLPRPSVLNASREPVSAPAPAPSPAANAAPGASGGEASVSSDMPDFPYPWYISQVRAALWSQWASKMPGGGGEATVEFTILKNGSTVDVRVESSSGEREVDYVALGAVQSASPFPPLPDGFPERFLKVHVRFKSQ